jgi:predicted nucleic acid-binding protein
MEFEGVPLNDIIIDTNPLVYIYSGVSGFGKNYANLLSDLSVRYNLIIPKLVYGELSLIFKNYDLLNEFLSDTGIIIGEIEPLAYLTAAKRWDKYNKRRILICQKCGKKLEQLICKGCSSEIHIRQHILTDFIIGACAFHTKERKIVTSDKGFISTYFPELTIIIES